MNTQNSQITLFLMSEKGYEFLRCTYKKFGKMFYQVVVGRDENIIQDYSEKIINFCLLNKINYCLDKKLKIKTEYVIAISWRWLINHPQDKLIIFHDSLLPKYRGFSPLVTSLINGEKKIGVTALLGNTEYDKGNILFQSISKVKYPLKILDAIKIIHSNYLECGEFILNIIFNKKKLISYSQDEKEASYSLWLDDADYNINWEKSAKEIKRFIDATGFPYKGACSKLDNQIVRILDVEEIKDVVIENRHHGKCIFLENGYPIVVCGEGLLKITKAFIETPQGPKSLIPPEKFRMKFRNK